jgi:hypothetical protein
MKFNIYNLIVEVPGMQLPLDKGVGGIYSHKAHLSAAADKLLAALLAIFFFSFFSQRPTAAGRTLSRKEIVVDLPQAG